MELRWPLSRNLPGYSAKAEFIVLVARLLLGAMVILASLAALGPPIGIVLGVVGFIAVQFLMAYIWGGASADPEG